MSPTGLKFTPAFITGLGSLALAAGLKLGLLIGGKFPFNADEAVVALMARHILQGARPVFFYGQAYMGSLDAWLVSAGFVIFGQEVWVIRMVQILLYLAVLATTGMLGGRLFESQAVGALAMLLLAVPTVNTTLYTTVSLGGYGEALLLGNLILLAAALLSKHIRSGEFGSGWLWAGLGFLTGLGLWAFGLALVYAFSALAVLALRIFRTWGEGSNLWKKWMPSAAALIAGGLLGSAPWWIEALRGQLPLLVSELGGAAVAGVQQLPWSLALWQRVVGLALLGLTAAFGLRPPWSVDWLAIPLIPFVLMFWAAVMLDQWKQIRRGGLWIGDQALLWCVILILLAAFVLTPFGADPSGRYFLPLAVPLALFAADFIVKESAQHGKWAFALAALLLIFHLCGTLQVAGRFPPGITTQFYPPTQVDHRPMDELMAFLRENGERRGFTNYWVSYPLAFLSNEELIFTPRLPYHLNFRYTRRDDRYPPYDRQIAQAERVAYITTHHPALNRYLRQHFSDLGVRWQERQIGDYSVFYALSRPVQPEEMGLGETSGPK